MTALARILVGVGGLLIEAGEGLASLGRRAHLRTLPRVVNGGRRVPHPKRGRR